MDGRRPKGVAYVSGWCEDRSREQDFVNWYKTRHFTDVGRLRVLKHPAIFMNMSTRRQGDDTILATYEIYDDNLEDAIDRFSKAASHLRVDFNNQAGVRSPRRGIYRVLAQHQQPRRCETLVAQRIDCKRDANMATLKEWLTTQWLLEVTTTGTFHSATVCEIIGDPFLRTPGQSQMLGLYETDKALGPDAAQHTRCRFVAQAPPLMRAVSTQAFRRA